MLSSLDTKLVRCSPSALVSRSLEQAPVIFPPSENALLPLADRQPKLIHDASGQEIPVLEESGTMHGFVVIAVLRLHGVGSEQHARLRRAVHGFGENRLFDLKEEELLEDGKRTIATLKVSKNDVREFYPR